MTDKELLQLNGEGFFPGPTETAAQLALRVEEMRKAAEQLPNPIPPSHWDWVRLHLRELFGFAPHCLPAFYSNRSLMPWQGAASWIANGRLVAVQLREALRNGSFLRLYQREEILAHESVHAARSPFPESRWEEFFAYMTSEKKWRRALGPIVQRPWEVWPFLVACLFGPLWPVLFLGAALWATLGFGQLIWGHRVLRSAAENLKDKVRQEKDVRAVLLRLTDEEIQRLSRSQEVGDDSLRWRLLHLAYWREPQGFFSEGEKFTTETRRGERLHREKIFFFARAKKKVPCREARQQSLDSLTTFCRASRQSIFFFALAKKKFSPLCNLSPLRVSVVNFFSTQVFSMTRSWRKP